MTHLLDERIEMYWITDHTLKFGKMCTVPVKNKMKYNTRDNFQCDHNLPSFNRKQIF